MGSQKARRVLKKTKVNSFLLHLRHWYDRRHVSHFAALASNIDVIIKAIDYLIIDSVEQPIVVMDAIFELVFDN